MRLSGSGVGFLWGVPVLSGLFTLVTVVVLARVGGRLLGIRLRWRRAVLAGFAGLVLGWAAAWSIDGQRRGPQTLSWPAVLVDATVVRLVLVPAVMELLGKANWWLPGWLGRRLPARRAEALGGDEPAAGTAADPVAAR